MFRIRKIATSTFLLWCIFQAVIGQAQGNHDLVSGTLKVGWIGSLSGPVAKYALEAAARVAQDDINASGGIRGKRLELVFEDGQCNGAKAISAFQKLTSVHNLQFIIGGHCSPESLAIAPLASPKGILLVAAVSTSPLLSGISQNFFRISGEDNKKGDVIAKYAAQILKTKRAVTISEQTDYATPLADRFADVFAKEGGQILERAEFGSSETDFRAILTRIRTKNPDIIYISTQSNDPSALLLKQIHNLGIKVQLLGNDVVGNTGETNPEVLSYMKRLIFAEPAFDTEAPETKRVLHASLQRNNTSDASIGVWTAEAYDAVRVLANALNECGEKVDEAAKCLSKLHNYNGVSGTFSINTKHDGVRKIALKQIDEDTKTRLIGVFD